MNQKRNLKITVAVCVTALAATWAPSAQATNVCNEARTGHSGIYDATDSDRNPPARYQVGLAPIGDSEGLIHAAERSPALSVCVAPGGGGGVS